MPADTSPSSEDRIFEFLCKTGLTPEDAFILFAGIREMASTNLIARFEAKLDAMRSEMHSQMNILRWVMGLGFAALVAAAIAQLFRG